MMRVLFTLLTLSLLAACTEEQTPVFGSGAWEFRSLGLLMDDPCTTPGPIVMSGENGEERDNKTFIARCRGTTRADGDLGLHLQLDNQNGERIELRLVLPSDAIPREGEASVAPSSCPGSMSFDARGQIYEATCHLESEDLDGAGGECIIHDVLVNRDNSSVIVRFQCDAVSDALSTSVCNIVGAGSSDAVLSFEGCEGL